MQISLVERTVRALLVYDVNIIESGHVFRPIAQSNPKFETIYISENDNIESERDSNTSLIILDDLVHTFSKCNELSFELSISDGQVVDEKKLRDICAALPCRGVDISVAVGSTLYQQKTSVDSIWVQVRNRLPHSSGELKKLLIADFVSFNILLDTQSRFLEEKLQLREEMNLLYWTRCNIVQFLLREIHHRDPTLRTNSLRLKLL